MMKAVTVVSLPDLRIDGQEPASNGGIKSTGGVKRKGGEEGFPRWREPEEKEIFRSMS